MERLKLGDICKIVSGGTPKTNIKEYWDGDKKWITPAELNDNSYIITDSVRKLTEFGVLKTGLTPFPEGTVILSSRAPIGKVAIAGCEMYCNQGFKNFICTDKIYNKYLYWFLRSKTAYLNSLGRGATFKEISKQIVSDIEIDVPELSEQRQIVARLEKIAEIAELRKNEIHEIDNLIKSRFVETFGDIETNPFNWKKSSVGEECFYIKDGPHKSPPYVETGTGIPFISTRNVVNGDKIDWSTAKYISESDYLECIKKCKPEKGDILYSKGGTTGIAKVVDTDKKFANWVHVAVLKFGEQLDGKFFECMLNSDYCYAQSQRLTKGIANRDFVLSAIAQVKIYVPPIEKQLEYVAFVQSVDKLKSEIQKSLDETQTLMDSLMQKYFG